MASTAQRTGTHRDPRAPGAQAPVPGAGRGRREPVQERSRRTVARILAAAEAIVAQDGVDAASTRAIARRAGVSAPSLYRFFDDRDAILDALLESLLTELEAATEQAEAAFAGTSIEDFVCSEMELHVSYYERHPSLVRLWFGGRVSPPVVELVHARNRALAARAHSLLTGAGLLAPDTPETVAELLVEFGDRALALAFRDGPADRAVIEAAIEGLAAFAGHWAQAPPAPHHRNANPKEGR